MNFIRRLLNKRKHKRYISCGETYLIIHPYTENEAKVQVIDISNGGCAFVYQGKKSDLEETGLANLLAENRLYLERTRYNTRSDTKLNPFARRRGVEFVYMCIRDKQQLKECVDASSLCLC